MKRERSQQHLPEPDMRWYYPALFGAAFLFCVVALRVALAIPYLLNHPQEVPEVGFTLLAATGAGAAGGLTYTLVGVPLRRIPKIGRYLAGITIISSYLIALIVAAPWMGLPPIVEQWSAGAVVSFTLVAVFFGVLIGREWFE